jgi:hypothetical protein
MFLLSHGLKLILELPIAGAPWRFPSRTLSCTHNNLGSESLTAGLRRGRLGERGYMRHAASSRPPAKQPPNAEHADGKYLVLLMVFEGGLREEVLPFVERTDDSTAVRHARNVVSATLTQNLHVSARLPRG